MPNPLTEVLKQKSGQIRKGGAPKHVTMNQIFTGMLPFMAIQVLALALL